MVELGRLKVDAAPTPNPTPTPPAAAAPVVAPVAAPMSPTAEAPSMLAVEDVTVRRLTDRMNCCRAAETAGVDEDADAAQADAATADDGWLVKYEMVDAAQAHFDT